MDKDNKPLTDVGLIDAQAANKWEHKIEVEPGFLVITGEDTMLTVLRASDDDCFFPYAVMMLDVVKEHKNKTKKQYLIHIVDWDFVQQLKAEKKNAIQNKNPQSNDKKTKPAKPDKDKQ
jgi:hypothetical protein